MIYSVDLKLIRIDVRNKSCTSKKQFIHKLGNLKGSYILCKFRSVVHFRTSRLNFTYYLKISL